MDSRETSVWVILLFYAVRQEHYLKIEPPTPKWFNEISANGIDLTRPINSCNKHGY